MALDASYEGLPGEVDMMGIFETIGMAYTILATTVFTLEVIYCCAKGISTLRHHLARGQGAEERRKDAKRPMIKLQG